MSIDESYSGAKLHPADQEIIRLRNRIAELEGSLAAERQNTYSSEVRERVSMGLANSYREALENTYNALKDPAFVRCTRCGWQESTSDMDVMSLYIKPALGIE